MRFTRIIALAFAFAVLATACATHGKKAAKSGPFIPDGADPVPICPGPCANAASVHPAVAVAKK